MIVIDETIPGWCPPDILTCFGWLMHKLPTPSTVVEIGVLWGRVTGTLALNKKPNTKIICIDPCIEAEYIIKLTSKQRITKIPYNYNNLQYFEDYIQQYGSVSLKQIVLHSTKQNDIVCIQQRSEEVTINFPVDIAIIDGMHAGTAPLLDMEKFINQPECLIIMDDWCGKWPDIINAVSIAREKYCRNIWIPSRGNYVYILPQTGPLLSVMKEFISLSATDNSWKLVNALHASA
jgi:hypothetical protein